MLDLRRIHRIELYVAFCFSFRHIRVRFTSILYISAIVIVQTSGIGTFIALYIYIYIYVCVCVCVCVWTYFIRVYNHTSECLTL